MPYQPECARKVKQAAYFQPQKHELHLLFLSTSLQLLVAARYPEEIVVVEVNEYQNKVIY